MVAAFVAAFAFTSCNTGDDNNYTKPLTKSEKDVCYLKTAGSRMSKLAYMSDEHVTETKGTKEYIDTLNVATDIYGNGKDTVMTVHNFPVKIFARYIPENAEMKDLKEALKNYEKMPVSFKSVVYYYSVTPALQFLLTPETMTVNLEYGGATHKVKFYFYANQPYSICNIGQINSTTNKLEAYFALYGYEVDPKDEKNPKPTTFNYNIAGKQYTVAQIKFFEP